MPFRPRTRVLVPVDFSALAFGALQAASEYVERPERITIVHVMVPISPSEPGNVWGRVDDASRERHVREALAKALSGTAFAGCPVEVRVGNPARQIAEVAVAVEAELVVLPSHGRTGLAHLALGSVAERVVRLAPCPVLTLRGEWPGKPAEE